MTAYPEDSYLHGLRINAEGNGRFQVCFDQHDMHGPTGRWWALARNFDTQQAAADFIAQIANRIHAYDVTKLAERDSENARARRQIADLLRRIDECTADRHHRWRQLDQCLCRWCCLEKEADAARSNWIA